MECSQWSQKGRSASRRNFREDPCHSRNANPPTKVTVEMNESATQIRAIVRTIVSALVKGRYFDIEDLTHGMRLSAAELQEAVTTYGRTLVMPPDELFARLDIIRTDSSDPPTWFVVCEMWTKEEGRSDLSLELTIFETPEGFRAEVDNLHVQ